MKRSASVIAVHSSPKKIKQASLGLPCDPSAVERAVKPIALLAAFNAVCDDPLREGGGEAIIPWDKAEQIIIDLEETDSAKGALA